MSSFRDQPLLVNEKGLVAPIWVIAAEDIESGIWVSHA
jgi:hypothetical protein